MAHSGYIGVKAVLFQSQKRVLERNRIKSVPKRESLEQIYGTLEHMISTGIKGRVPMFLKYI